jgi:hypothetical protein
MSETQKYEDSKLSKMSIDEVLNAGRESMEKSSYDNGTEPSFPCLRNLTHVNGETVLQGAQLDRHTVWSMGLTKREQFAMAAMQGLCANYSIDSRKNTHDIAESAVKMADSMLVELEMTKCTPLSIDP